jgi:hypothetical protein
LSSSKSPTPKLRRQMTQTCSHQMVPCPGINSSAKIHPFD